MQTDENKTVDIDTSGPGAEIDVPEEKDESVVETVIKTIISPIIHLRNLMSSLLFKLAKLKKKMKS
jgi:hypothetical protein